MNYLDKYKDNYQKFPRLHEMKMLWHGNYWDGPLAGMCLIDSQKYWFECIEQYHDNNPYPSEEEYDAGWESPWYRRFLVWKLTDEQLKVIEERHAKFQRMVGTHCDYDESGKQRGYFHYNDTITEETFKQFYAESKLEKPVDITPTDEQILGWYEW